VREADDSGGASLDPPQPANSRQVLPSKATVRVADAFMYLAIYLRPSPSAPSRRSIGRGR
jgi:hypothetical protein